MANYAFMGKGIASMTKEGEATARDVGNVSALNIKVSENTIKQKNYRTAGGGTYAQVNQIESVQISMTLCDLSPENLAMVLFGTATTDTENSTAVIEALTTGAQTFKMEFAGLNEAAGGSAVDVTAYRVKVGAAQDIGLIGDDFSTLQITGELLLDTSITDSGKSQYFKIEMATQA